MKKMILIILSVSLSCLVGCQQHTEQEKEQASKSVMGNGKQPMPKPGEHINGI